MSMTGLRRVWRGSSGPQFEAVFCKGLVWEVTGFKPSASALRFRPFLVLEVEVAARGRVVVPVRRLLTSSLA